MAAPLDATIRRGDLARYIGALVLECWELQRKVEVLEAHVDALDPPKQNETVTAPDA